MNIDTLSDRELATCVDEFVQRAINRARKVGYDKNVTVTVTATSFGPDSEYKIEHRAQVGEWNKPYNSETNNLVGAVDNAVSRWLADQLDAPTTVRPLLTHEPEQEAYVAPTQEEIDTAEFVPIDEQELRDADES
jgi:hypothetical protein